jgi:hypothetical protein
MDRSVMDKLLVMSLLGFAYLGGSGLRSCLSIIAVSVGLTRYLDVVEK